MRFSTMMIPFLTVAPALAATTCTNAITPTRQDIVDAANTYYDVSQAAGCDWLACVSSLAGETAACAAAAVELGANIIADIACLASVGSAGAACKSC